MNQSTAKQQLSSTRKSGRSLNGGQSKTASELTTIHNNNTTQPNNNNKIKIHKSTARDSSKKKGT
jgi:hypothetical protein